MVVNVYEGCDCATLNTSITVQLLLNTAIYYCMAVINITEHSYCCMAATIITATSEHGYYCMTINLHN